MAPNCSGPGVTVQTRMNVTERVEVTRAHAGSWDLVRAAQRENRNAFGELYSIYAPRIFRYLIARVPDHALAEDLTSDTFVRAIRSINAVNYAGKDIGAWLTTIARNLLLDHLKSSRHRLEVTSVATGHEQMSDDTPEESVLRAEDRYHLRACLAQLTWDQRRCLELRYLQERSLDETAIELGRCVNAVKALQHRALRKLAALVCGQTVR